MEQYSIGLDCCLPNAEFNIAKWLNGLPLERYQLFIQTLMFTDLTQDIICKRITTLGELEGLNHKYGVMEITLSIFPVGTPPHIISDYLQFLNSLCVCCLIYYDAGFLELYTKENKWLEKLEGNLQNCSPDHIVFKTLESDTRSHF